MGSRTIFQNHFLSNFSSFAMLSRDAESLSRVIVSKANIQIELLMCAVAILFLEQRLPNIVVMEFGLTSQKIVWIVTLL